MSDFSHFPIPLLGFAAFSGTGKTTLLELLIPLLVAQGLKVALVKHSHHDIEHFARRILACFSCELSLHKAKLYCAFEVDKTR